jgi:hypothetical protein
LRFETNFGSIICNSAWLLGRHPDHKILRLARSRPDARASAVICATLIVTSEYGAMFPALKLSQDAGAPGHWRTNLLARPVQCSREKEQHRSGRSDNLLSQLVKKSQRRDSNPQRPDWEAVRHFDINDL